MRETMNEKSGIEITNSAEITVTPHVGERVSVNGGPPQSGPVKVKFGDMVVVIPVEAPIHQANKKDPTP